jgi:hypothetical protein
MPCGYHISIDDGLITVTGSGHVSVLQAIALGQALLADTEFDGRVPQLVDLRGLVLPQALRETEQFREFVLGHFQPAVSASVAVVVDDSLDTRSTAALYHLICSLHQAELFDRYEHALRWLLQHEFRAPVQ